MNLAPMWIEGLRLCDCGGEAIVFEVPAHTHTLATEMPEYPGETFIECRRCDVPLLAAPTTTEAMARWNRGEGRAFKREDEEVSEKRFIITAEVVDTEGRTENEVIDLVTHSLDREDLEVEMLTVEEDPRG